MSHWKDRLNAEQRASVKTFGFTCACGRDFFTSVYVNHSQEDSPYNGLAVHFGHRNIDEIKYGSLEMDTKDIVEALLTQYNRYFARWENECGLLDAPRVFPWP